MESYEERMQKLIEQDIPPFLALCSEKDRKFLLNGTVTARPKNMSVCSISACIQNAGVFSASSARRNTEGMQTK